MEKSKKNLKSDINVTQLASVGKTLNQIGLGQGTNELETRLKKAIEQEIYQDENDAVTQYFAVKPDQDYLPHLVF